MKVKSVTKKAGSRILAKADKRQGIINYDEDNCYPQRMMLLTNSSPTAKACLEIYGRFIEGGGFKNKMFYKAVVNSDGQTNDKILRLCRNDLKVCRGFAIHLHVTLTGRVVEYYHVPFEHVRKATEAKTLETGYHYAIYPDWSKQLESNIKQNSITWLHAVKLNTLAIAQQAIDAGGFDNYKGQLLYVSLDEGSYPLSSADAILESLFAEIQSDISTTNNIEENFTAKGMIVHKGKFEDEDAKEEFEDSVEEFIGPEGASVIVVDIEKEEDKPEFIKIDSNINDKIFEYTDKKITNKIIRNYLIPKILLSVTDDGGGFFNQEQIRDATHYYNAITILERTILEEAFSLLGRAFINNINDANDYTILPVKFKINKNELPVGMVDLITNEKLSVLVRRKLLAEFFDVDEELAVELVPDEIEPLAT